MVGDFARGFTAFFGAITKINKYGLKTHLLISALISLLIGGLVIFAGIIFFYNYAGAIVGLILPFDIHSVVLQKIISIVFIGIFFFVLYFIYKYMLWILLGPVLGQISQKIEFQLIGKKENSSFLAIPKGITRGVIFSFQNMFKEIFYTLLLLIVSLFPFVGIISMPLLFLIQSYFIGLGNFDFYAERHFTINETKRIGKANRWIMIGIGSAFSFCILIPFFGMIFAPIFATISATELAIKRTIKMQ
jgi:CysZ protein